ncbi:MAG: radical SAM family heme chaperone HemW, partial [Deltaproteobacteria bacterium]|nr:radical SAM family heme chaperone HemW [Deltaproteobacteria bacterium]
MPAHLYIHLPFCRSRCHYCAFPSVAVDTVPEKKYLTALLAEFRFRLKSWPGIVQPLSTLYFGGGTPSLFSPLFFSEIIDFFSHEAGFIEQPELTLEANPADVEMDKITGYRAAGINRISLGAQTFAPAGLRLLGRRHDAAAIDRAVVILRRAGIVNLSLDLIYAWPGQTCDDLEFDLQKISILEPEHVSAYNLSFEPGCEITRAVAAGEIVPVDEDLQLEMMQLLEDNLDKAGLYRYEVSNFAKNPGFQSRHNLAYWQLKDFIGLGAGACGGWRSRKGPEDWVERYCNTPDPFLYMQQLEILGSDQPDMIKSSTSWFEKEIVDLSDSFAEALMMGLRLRQGLDLGSLESEYGSDRVVVVIEKAQLLCREG